MNKSQLLQSFTPETRQLFALSLDRLEKRDRRGIATSTPFFTPEEQQDFSSLLGKLDPFCDYHFLGGYPAAERKLCYFPASWEEFDPSSPPDTWDEEPISLLCGKVKGEVGHRDVLGSLMGLGLTRRTLGDILVADQLVQVIAQEEVTSILLSQWSQVGRFSVSLTQEPLTSLQLPPESRKEISTTVSSLRLDRLLSFGFGISRSKATSLISSGVVSVNHKECRKPDKSLEVGDLLVCRGLGKCKFKENRGETKKGRLFVVMEKYL